jgi:hypothetical protein
MSAQFFKIFSGVLLVHATVLSVVWVGFSAPRPRPAAAFTYEGALPAQEAIRLPKENLPQEPMAGQFDLDRFQAPYFNHWMQIKGNSR